MDIKKRRNILLQLNNPSPPPYPTIVSWADGTDEQIAAMVNSADAKQIALKDFWHIGDTRRVHLSAMGGEDPDGTAYETHIEQDVEFVIMDFNCNGFTTKNGKPSMIVGMKDGLIENGNMNSDQRIGGWYNCRRRAWCNDIFAKAIPSSFSSIFKKFAWQTSVGRAGQLHLTADIFALPPAKTVFGASSDSPEEAALYNWWAWYLTQDNRIKKNGINGSANSWWNVTTSKIEDGNFLLTNINGNPAIATEYQLSGLSPFGCV